MLKPEHLLGNWISKLWLLIYYILNITPSFLVCACTGHYIACTLVGEGMRSCHRKSGESQRYPAAPNRQGHCAINGCETFVLRWAAYMACGLPWASSSSQSKCKLHGIANLLIVRGRVMSMLSTPPISKLSMSIDNAKESLNIAILLMSRTSATA